jgi:hypothetical protein
MRLSLLRVPTLITPVHPRLKIKQDMWITWLSFGLELALEWLNFQLESTYRSEVVASDAGLEMVSHRFWEVIPPSVGIKAWDRI